MVKPPSGTYPHLHRPSQPDIINIIWLSGYNIILLYMVDVHTRIYRISCKLYFVFVIVVVSSV